MKWIFFLFGSLSMAMLSAQINFEEAYYIDSEGVKHQGWIKNVGWRNNPDRIEFKESEASESRPLLIDQISEFGFVEGVKFQKAELPIDRSSNMINALDRTAEPRFDNKVVLAEVLLEGKASLYYFRDPDVERYFYRKEQGDIKPLVQKKYLDSDNQVRNNNSFRQELWANLPCEKFTMSDLENLSYQRKSLLNHFIEYHECIDAEYTIYKKSSSGISLSLSILPRLNFNSLELNNTANSGSSSTNNIDQKTGFGFGLALEYILPFNQDHWTLLLEPSYNVYSNQISTQDKNIRGGIVNLAVDYPHFEIPLGLRYRYFLNAQSLLFVNLAYVAHLSPGGSITFSRNDGSIFNEVDTKSDGNLAIGIGYKFRDKLSLEFRYQRPREILGNYVYWDAPYQSNSIILGYTIF